MNFVADQHIRVHVQERVPSVVIAVVTFQLGSTFPTCVRVGLSCDLVGRSLIGVASLIQPSPHLGTGAPPEVLSWRMQWYALVLYSAPRRHRGACGEARSP
jgi:hypothetical protein